MKKTRKPRHEVGQFFRAINEINQETLAGYVYVGRRKYVYSFYNCAQNIFMSYTATGKACNRDRLTAAKLAVECGGCTHDWDSICAVCYTTVVK